METYRYSSLDIASYIKWTQLDPDKELEMMTAVWPARHVLLDEELTDAFPAFRDAVYEQLYFLSQRGYTDEHSDLILIRDDIGFPEHLLPHKLFRLETAFKLLTLHLIMTPHLPYVRFDAADLVMTINAQPLTETLAQQLLDLGRTLGLMIARENGFPCDAESMLEELFILIGLSAEYTRTLRPTLPFIARYHAPVVDFATDGPED